MSLSLNIKIMAQHCRAHGFSEKCACSEALNKHRTLYLERGSRHHLVGGTAKSDGRAVAAICRSPISSDMKTNTSASSPGEIRSYVQLQQQIHHALREQHPEWIEQNGDCPTCESYESRFAELLDVFLSNERKSAA